MTSGWSLHLSKTLFLDSNMGTSSQLLSWEPNEEMGVTAFWNALNPGHPGFIGGDQSL